MMRRALVGMGLLSFCLFMLGPVVGQHHHGGGLDSGELQAGQSYESHFDAPGSYLYHCHPHPFMEGTVGVSDEAPNGTVEVRVKDYEFVPRNVTIRTGETIRFINDGPSAHTVNAGAGVTPTPSASGTADIGFVLAGVAILALAAVRRNG